MKVQANIKHSICALFDVTDTENGGWCVVTPMQYSGSNDNIVVHIRPDGNGWQIHDNGDAVMNANLLGFDADTDAIDRWSVDLKLHSPVAYDVQSEYLVAQTSNDKLLAPYAFRVAEAAQQLFTIATQRQERRASNFKEQVADVIVALAQTLSVPFKEDVELPIAGGLTADFVIDRPEPLIVIAATSVARLMEAEIIFMQYRHQKIPGFVLAIAESPQSVGRKQFDRANYYTGKTVSFDPHHLADLVKSRIS
jgi:hypothetical protein